MFNRNSDKPLLSLALQGGGAHGAFTWGVLDALLEAGLYRFEGLSGTSAGAMNAVAVAHGLSSGGSDAARETLALFWSRVGATLPAEMVQPVGLGGDSALSPGLRMALQFTRWFSPYQLNPLDYNPLRTIIQDLFDFERIRKQSPVKLFVAATQANTGRLKLFQNADISADALLASSCLPSLQQAIVIDGEPYWDGGFSANPAVFPLVRYCRSDDMLLVLLAPTLYGATPRSAEEIQQRTVNLGFNSAFLREMRLFALLRDMAQEGGPLRGRLERRLLSSRFHLIEAHDLISDLDSSSRGLTHVPFLEWLRDAGRERAQEWLTLNGSKVGHLPSVDIKALFFD